MPDFNKNLEVKRTALSPEERRKEFERTLRSDNPWNRSPLGVEAEKAAMSMMSTRHGLYAKVPIYCKGDTCPYSFQCDLLSAGLAPVGERCPVESARIANEYAGYSEDFDIDNASQTDKILLSEIVSMDILASRATALMAKELSPVQEIAIGVSDDGDEIMQPAVSKAWEAYQSISKRRNETLQLMMATRKDKSKDDTPIQNTVQDILAQVVSDPDFEEVEQRPEDIVDTDRTKLK